MPKCPGCDNRVPTGEDKSLNWRDGNWHHICVMKDRGEYDGLMALYHLQDDNDPETRITDILISVGHLCDELNKRLRGNNRIDFEAAVESAMRHYEVERR